MSRTYLWQLWDRLQSSYWFLPLVSAVIAVVLAFLLHSIDSVVDSQSVAFKSFLLSGDTESMRALLTNLATTTLTTGGIVFTLLTLPLSVVVAQFGSRLVRVYLRDHTTQGVLAIFAGTFTYCVALSLAIPPAEVSPDPPAISVTFALLLALICFASLVVLVHHVGVTLQAPNIVAAASRELMAVVDGVIAQSQREMQYGDREATQALSARIENEGKPIVADTTGYVQYVDVERLLPFASRRDLLLRLIRTPGDFVEKDELLAYVWPAERVPNWFMRRVQRSFYVGHLRLPNQDTEYAINQVTEVGVRALSSAINDPYTAMTALDHVAAALGAYAEHVQDHSSYYDTHGKVRVIYSPVNFSTLVDAAYNLPRLAIGNNSVLYLHLLRGIDSVARRTDNASRLSALLEHVTLIQEQIAIAQMTQSDKHAVNQLCEEIMGEVSKRIEA